MELQRMRELADLMNQAGLTAVEVWEGSDKVRLERGPAPAAQPTGCPAQTAAPRETPEEEKPHPAGKPVKSPMVGVFTAPRARNSPPLCRWATG